MESPFRPIASPAPGTPLHSMSPERANRQMLAQSPSLPSPSMRLRDDPFSMPSSRNSDVMGKVLQFNNLGSPKHKTNEAALRRAVVGREEAEGETRRLREENTVLKQQHEGGKERELKVSQRLESVMEEMQKLKERDDHKHTVYEKEVRRARKEAFKASSNLVKLQEELRSAKNKATLMREEVEVQKRKLDVREKEIFAAQYDQIGLQEELDNIKQKMKLVEEERDALRTSLKEEEVARIAAEGRIPLPPSTPDAEFASPKKARPLPPRTGSYRDHQELSQPVARDEELETLHRELKAAKRYGKEKSELVDFMNLECQLYLCSCRRAEAKGTKYTFVQDLHEWDEDEIFGEGGQAAFIETLSAAERSILIPEKDVGTKSEAHPWVKPEEVEPSPPELQGTEAKVHTSLQVATEEVSNQEHVEFDARSGTFRRISLLGQSGDSTPRPNSRTSRLAPLQACHSPGLVSIAPPLNPVDLSESPSLFSLGGEFCPPDKGSRQSDECMVIGDQGTSVISPKECTDVKQTPSILPASNPATPKASHNVTPTHSSTESSTKPHGGLPHAPIEFPPTPSADLTLTAPINFNISLPIRPVEASPPAMGSRTEPINRPYTPASHSHPLFIAEPRTEPRGGMMLTPFEPLTEPRAPPVFTPFEPEASLNTSTRIVETTITTTVPLAGDGESTRKFPYSPGASKTREEALESIQRWRQGRQRARSATGVIGGTPRKALLSERRDITK